MYSLTSPILFLLASFLANASVGESSKLRMTPAFEASLVLNSLSLVAGAILLLCLVRMSLCWENTLSQLAVWRGSVRAICDSLMRSGSSSLWCFVRSSHSPCILLTGYLAAFTMVLAYCHCWLTLSLDRSGCEIWCLWVYKVKERLSVGASCLIMLDVL